MQALAETDEVEQLDAALDAVVRVHTRENGRQRYVLQSGHDRDEVERLEDVPDRVTAEVGELLRIELRHVHVIDEDRARSSAYRVRRSR